MSISASCETSSIFLFPQLSFLPCRTPPSLFSMALDNDVVTHTEAIALAPPPPPFPQPIPRMPARTANTLTVLHVTTHRPTHTCAHNVWIRKTGHAKMVINCYAGQALGRAGRGWQRLPILRVAWPSAALCSPPPASAGACSAMAWSGLPPAIKGVPEGGTKQGCQREQSAAMLDDEVITHIIPRSGGRVDVGAGWWQGEGRGKKPLTLRLPQITTNTTREATQQS